MAATVAATTTTKAAAANEPAKIERKKPCATTPAQTLLDGGRALWR